MLLNSSQSYRQLLVNLFGFMLRKMANFIGFAKEGRMMDIINILTLDNSFVDQKDEYGNSALMWAAKFGHVDIVKILLRNRNNVNVKGFRGWTALIAAATLGHPDVLYTLIINGADVDAQDNNGRTALIWAAINGHDIAANILTNHHAQINIKSHNGKTAIYYMPDLLRKRFEITVGMPTTRNPHSAHNISTLDQESGLPEDLALRFYHLKLESLTLLQRLSVAKPFLDFDHLDRISSEINRLCFRLNIPPARNDRSTSRSVKAIVEAGPVLFNDIFAYSQTLDRTSMQSLTISHATKTLSEIIESIKQGSHNTVKTNTPRNVESYDHRQILEVPHTEIVLEREISNRGSSTVFTAEWRGHYTAVKVLTLPSQTTSTCNDSIKRNNNIEQLQSEITILSQLHHPRLLSVMAFCPDMNLIEGDIGFVSEYMPLGSLYQILHGAPQQLSLSRGAPRTQRYLVNNNVQRLNIALDIADGMRFLHGANMLHRNLKSANILMDGYRRAKIADFGLLSCQEFKNLPSFTSEIGTPIAWTAPELFMREENISASSDVYSFGVVLWELFSGRVPWQGLSAMNIVSIVGNQSKRLTIASHWPSPIKSLLIQCFQPQHHRPKFEDIYRILMALMAERPVVGEPVECV